MFGFYISYYFGGMHIVWWIIMILFFVWLYATPWGKRRNRDASYDILKKRLSGGEITKGEYQEAKRVLEEDFHKVYKENKG